MARTLDLAGLISPTANMQSIGDRFERGFRRRPEILQGRWIFSEPPEGLQPTPLLTVGQAIALREEDFDDIARRIGIFLSTEFDKDRPPIPTLKASEGYGLLSELEQLHLKLFFADTKTDLALRLKRDLLPFMVKKFGATHVCVVRPNYVGTQSRISLLKFFWAAQAFGQTSVKEMVLDQQILDSILPSPHDMTQWIEAFLTLAPAQMALPISLMGGYAVFFGPQRWIFPRIAALGMLSNFTSSVALATSKDDVMIQSVNFQGGTAERVHAYIHMAARTVNNLVDFATNPLSFLNGQQLKGLEQVQFVSALNLFMSDIRLLNATIGPYERMSFSFSALDKLANIVATVSTKKLDEPKVFKSFFSASTVRGLRRISRDFRGQSHSVEDEILSAMPKRLIEVQRSIRKQMRGPSKEVKRLEWLWSYRNLRHGTYLRRSQFQDLFVAARGIAPAELAQATMALLIAFGASPKKFLDTF